MRDFRFELSFCAFFGLLGRGIDSKVVVVVVIWRECGRVVSVLSNKVLEKE